MLMPQLLATAPEMGGADGWAGGRTGWAVPKKTQVETAIGMLMGVPSWGCKFWLRCAAFLWFFDFSKTAQNRPKPIPRWVLDDSEHF